MLYVDLLPLLSSSSQAFRYVSAANVTSRNVDYSTKIDFRSQTIFYSFDDSI
jgi:hypothetical protein